MSGSEKLSGIEPGQRVFLVRMQGREVLDHFDIRREAGGHNRGVVQEFRGVKVREALELDFASATEKPAILCGVELIEERAEQNQLERRHAVDGDDQTEAATVRGQCPCAVQDTRAG